MVFYILNQLSGDGTLIESLTSGSSYIFDVILFISSSTYLTLETVRNPIDFYDSPSPTTSASSIENLTNITGIVSSSYIFSAVVGQGEGSFTFTPKDNVAASGSFLRRTGGISLTIS